MTIVRPVLEKQRSSVLTSTSLEEATQNSAACAARLEGMAAGELGKMGLSLVSFSMCSAHGRPRVQVESPRHPQTFRYGVTRTR